MICKFCKHTGIITLPDGLKIEACRKVKPKINGRICLDFERKEKKEEFIQENLFKLIDKLK